VVLSYAIPAPPHACAALFKRTSIFSWQHGFDKLAMTGYTGGKCLTNTVLSGSPPPIVLAAFLRLNYAGCGRIKHLRGISPTDLVQFVSARLQVIMRGVSPLTKDTKVMHTDNAQTDSVHSTLKSIFKRTSIFLWQHGFDKLAIRPYRCAQVLKTPSAAVTAPDSQAAFLYLACLFFSRVWANKIPFGGISPEFLYNSFEHPATCNRVGGQSSQKGRTAMHATDNIKAHRSSLCAKGDSINKTDALDLLDQDIAKLRFLLGVIAFTEPDELDTQGLCFFLQDIVTQLEDVESRIAALSARKLKE